MFSCKMIVELHMFISSTSHEHILKSLGCYLFRKKQIIFVFQRVCISLSRKQISDYMRCFLVGLSKMAFNSSTMFMT